MQLITLSNSTQKAIIDDEDLELVSKFAWWLDVQAGYARTHKRGHYRIRKIFLHTLITDSKNVDHKNRNKLDNQKINLRLATRSQNRANTTKQLSQTSSKYKGVSWSNAVKKWHAYITKDGKRVHLGYYINEYNAALAYNEKASELFGEFACFNEIVC